MDNNGERTDRFFRDRLVDYGESPGNQVWDKLTEKLEHGKKRKMLLFFFRVAAGMTLILSLGLGYYFATRHPQAENVAAVKPQESTEKHETGVIARENKKSPRVGQIPQGFTSAKKVSPESRALKNSVNVSFHETIAENITSSDDQQKLAYLQRIPSGLLNVQVPNQVGYRRLSQEEMYEQLALIMNDGESETAGSELSQHHWSIGSEVAPLYSYRTIESDYKDKTDYLNSTEQGLVALAGGLRAGYSASRRISVESGVYYSRYGQEKSNGKITTASYSGINQDPVKFLSIPNSTGTIYQPGHDSYEAIISETTHSAADLSKYTGFPAFSYLNAGNASEEMKAVQYFDYLELPLNVRYKVVDRKFNFSVVGGMVTNFLVNNGVRIESAGNVETAKTKDISKINYQASVGLGFGYPLFSKMTISLEPRFRYYLNPIYDKLDVHPYSFGLFAGISYSF
jgi:hypothetical protein